MSRQAVMAVGRRLLAPVGVQAMTRQRELDLIRERHAAGRFDSAPDHDAVTFLLNEIDRLTLDRDNWMAAQLAALDTITELRAIPAQVRREGGSTYEMNAVKVLAKIERLMDEVR